MTDDAHCPLAPRFLPLPHEAPPIPPPVEKKPAPLSLLAVLFGLLGFAMAWTPSLRPIAVALAGVGTLLGAVLLTPALTRGLNVSGLPLAGTLVSLQGLIVALALLPQPRTGTTDDRAAAVPSVVATIPGPQPEEPESPQQPPDRPIDSESLKALRQAREAWSESGQLGPALSACLPRLGHEDGTVREEAGAWLRELGAPAVAEIAPKLKHEDRESRRTAVRALAALGPLAKNELTALLRAMGDSDATVRLYAAKAVHAITLQSKFVVPVLRRCLEDEDADVRREAAEALKQIE